MGHDRTAKKRPNALECREEAAKLEDHFAQRILTLACSVGTKYSYLNWIAVGNADNVVDDSDPGLEAQLAGLHMVVAWHAR